MNNKSIKPEIPYNIYFINLNIYSFLTITNLAPLDSIIKLMLTGACIITLVSKTRVRFPSKP